MRAFAGATATSGYTRKRESAHIKDTSRPPASQMRPPLSPSRKATGRESCPHFAKCDQLVQRWVAAIAGLIPRRTSFNASRRSAGSAARYSVTVDAGMGQVYHEGFCRGNCNVRIHAEARKRAYQGHGAAVRQPNVKCLDATPAQRPSRRRRGESHVHTLQSVTNWVNAWLPP